jgi:hypothetical protein
MAVFWIVAPCSLVEVYGKSEVLMVEAASIFETMVNFYETTRHYSPKDRHLLFSSTASIQNTSVLYD